MFGYAANPIASYKNNETNIAVASSDPHHLVQLLFDGATQGIALARVHMSNGNTAEKGRLISQVIDIINHGLKASLNFDNGGNITKNLDALYSYMTTRLLFANINNDIAILDEIGTLLGELSSAWAKIAPNKTET